MFRFFAKCVLFSAGILFPVLLPAGGEGETPEVIRRPADEVFVDDATGFRFFRRIGAYSKAAVSCSVNPAYGTIVRYQNEIAYGDVYIYSLDSHGTPVKQSDLDQEFEKVSKAILQLPQNSGLVKSVQTIADTPGKLPDGVRYRHFRICTEDDTMGSLMLMFLQNGRIVKIRVSYPVEDPLELQNAVRFYSTILQLAK